MRHVLDSGAFAPILRGPGWCPVSILWRHIGRGPGDYTKLSHASPRTPHLAHAIIANVPTETTIQSPRTAAIALTALGGIGVVSSFASVIIAFAGIKAAGTGVKLIGADNELGYPSSAFALILFAAFLALGVAQLAGAVLKPGWWLAITPLALIGTVFELWVIYLALRPTAVSPLFVVQALVFIGIFALAVRLMPRGGSTTVLGIWLILASSAGFLAAIRLVSDKVGTFVSPDVAPTCDVSVLVQCGKNLSSPEGSVFGFPNPLIGVGGWIAVLMVGVMLLAGLRFARWFWIAFNLGMLGALAFIVWLITQSIFTLGTLCPWCMTTWVAVIPTFLLVTLYNLREGTFGDGRRLRSIGAALYGFVPVLSLVCFAVIFLIAQVQLDVIHRF